jgi:hypothetical protein
MASSLGLLIACWPLVVSCSGSDKCWCGNMDTASLFFGCRRCCSLVLLILLKSFGSVPNRAGQRVPSFFSRLFADGLFYRREWVRVSVRLKERPSANSRTKLHGLMIAKMQHHVKTALGISSAFFQSTPEKVLYGSGQGSSGSPPLWMSISIILFQALEARMGPGANFSCPRRKKVSSLTTKAWVDDSNDYLNDFLEHFPWTETKLCAELEKQNQEWEQLLSASGGKLELPKCLAYIVVYDFVDSKPVQRSKEQMSANFT